MPLTASQHLAVTTEGTSILLNAGAGSGKTHVLTERVVRMLSDGRVQSGEVLVLTFTKAAAQEMKNRISAKMQTLLEQAEARLSVSEDDPSLEKEAAFLRKQLVMLPSASIQTIDSFCNDVVRQNHALAGLPANILMIQDLDQARMKNDVLDQIISEALQKDQETISDVLRTYGGVRKTKSEIRRLSEKLASFDDRDLWIQTALSGWNEENIVAAAMESIQNILLRELRKLEENADFLAQDPEQKPKSVAYLLNMEKQAAGLIHRLESAGLQELTSHDFAFLQKTSARIVDTGSQTQAKKLFADAKSTLKEFTEIQTVLEEQIRRMQVMKPVVETTIRLTGLFDQRYGDLKKARGLMDFADLESYALQILSIPMISDQYRKLYKHVFVDEYQDTNPVQEKIISRVAGDHNLFCVGDMKQSIYRFRSADPLLFRHRSERYLRNTQEGIVINLAQNFRSSTNVLNCCDDIFSHLATTSRELEYGEGDRLQVGRTVMGPVQETMLITCTKEELEAQDNSGFLESEAIAGYILKRMKQDIFDPELNDGNGGMRPCRWSDIAVIGRKRTEFLNSLVQVFSSAKIPYSLDKSGPLLKTLEARMLIQILGLAAGFEDDFAILNMLRNGFFGFTDEDMASLACVSGKRYMDRIQVCSETPETELGNKCRQITRFISDLKRLDDSSPLSDAISWAADQIGFRTWCASLPDGLQRLANLDLILKMASDFQRDGRNRLHAFVRGLNSLDPDLDSIPSAKTPAGKDCVLLTTIHGSKGMQYPIVIIPFAGKNIQGSSGILDPRLDVAHDISNPEKHAAAMPYLDPKLGLKGSIFLDDLIKAENRNKSLEEERRLLYVAMTRAQEELVITGQKPEDGKSASSLMGWILDALNSCPDHRGAWREQSMVDYAGYLETGSQPAAVVPYQPLKADPDQFEPEEEMTVFRDRYPVPIAVGASKAAASLKGTAQKESSPFRVVRNEEQLDEDTDHQEAARRGIRLHALMEQIEFSRIQDPGYLENKMVDMFGENREVADPEKLRLLFRQPEAQIILQADAVIREKAGSLLLPYSRLDSEYKGDLKTRIQAIMDLVVRKDGKWYLYDYKSDVIGGKPGSAGVEKKLAERIEHHRIQMELYRQILLDNFDIDIEASWLIFTDVPCFALVYSRQNTAFLSQLDEHGQK